MAGKKNLMTREGLKALEDELNDLKLNKRKEVAQKIKEAREQGDLSENAEYDAAKDEQRDIEARIEEIDNILKNAEVVEHDEGDADKVNVGATVKIKDIEFGDEMEYKIVGQQRLTVLIIKSQMNHLSGSCTYMGAKGCIIEIETPNGEMIKYEVMSVSR